jgi:hypothetical protein
MWRLLGLAICQLAISIAPACAEPWPEHGFFQVEDAYDHGQRFCRLRVELKVDHAIFAFILRENRSGSLLVQFMAQSPGLNATPRVRVAIDGKEVFDFTPEFRDDSPELPSVTAAVRDGEAGADIVHRLQTAAQGAKWFQVEALPYNKAIPATGLKEAMDDLATCQTVQQL